MKLLLVSDLHGIPKTLAYLESAIKKEGPEGVVFSGDITTWGETDFIDRVFEILSRNKTEGFMIWGNADSIEVQNKILNSPYNSHLTKRKFGNDSIFGISLIKEPPVLNPNDIKGSILVTHRPPLKAQLEKELANAPKYHISGHLHDFKFFKKYPSTTHIQVPSLQKGEYAIFNPDKNLVRFKSVT